MYLPYQKSQRQMYSCTKYTKIPIPSIWRLQLKTPFTALQRPNPLSSRLWCPGIRPSEQICHLSPGYYSNFRSWTGPRRFPYKFQAKPMRRNSDPLSPSVESFRSLTLCHPSHNFPSSDLQLNFLSSSQPPFHSFE